MTNTLTPPTKDGNAADATPRRSWRDHLKIHPACELFPTMGAAELRELAQDIAAHGLRQKCVKLIHPTEGVFLLDGRSRLDAIDMMSSLGLSQKKAIPEQRFIELSPKQVGDPYEFVVSLNLHRRHLTAAQKRDIIAKLLDAQPEKSDRQIAAAVKSSPTTVGGVRKSRVQSGHVPELAIRIDSKGRRQPARKPATPTAQAAVSRGAMMEAPKKQQAPAPIANTPPAPAPAPAVQPPATPVHSTTEDALFDVAIGAPAPTADVIVGLFMAASKEVRKQVWDRLWTEYHMATEEPPVAEKREARKAGAPDSGVPPIPDFLRRKREERRAAAEAERESHHPAVRPRGGGVQEEE
jgi:hypothetical protein